MPFKKNDPGCPCCDCFQWRDRIADESTAGFETVSPEWSIVDDYLQTTSDGAMLLVVNPPPQKTYVRCNLAQLLAGTVVRLVLGWQDENNYVYGEYTQCLRVVVSLGVSYDQASAEQRLGVVSGGVDTVLLESVYDHACVAAGDLTANDATLSLCYDGTDVIFHVANRITQGVASPPSYFGSPLQCELGIVPGYQWGAIVKSTYGGKAVRLRAFDSLLVGAGCPYCAPSCCDGPVPRNLIVTLYGTYEGWDPDSLSYESVDLSGAYVVTNQTQIYCSWGTASFSQYPQANVYTLAPQSQISPLFLRITDGSNGPTRFTFLFKLSPTDPPRCLDWESLVLPFDSVGTFGRIGGGDHYAEIRPA